MPQAIFPDNTVLCNFASVHRLDLLEGWLRGRGRWTEAVAYEARQSASWLPELETVHQRGWLGEPLELDDPSELGLVESIRRVVFGGSPSLPRKHLGEAQTCFLISERAEFREAWWLSDDEDAYEYAVGRGIRALRTIDVIRQIIADGDLTPPDGFALLHAMADSDRGLVLPDSARDLT